MNGEARELRFLARAIQELASESHAYSMVGPAVHALCDYLCLRARVMELQGALDEKLYQEISEEDAA